MKEFTFYGDLYEHRAKAVEALSRAGLELFSDYSSVDIEHNLYGLEVGGFNNEELALKALEVLRATFPEWGFATFLEYETGEPFWARLSRDREEIPSFEF